MRDSKRTDSSTQHSLQKKPDVQEDKACKAVRHCHFQEHKNSKMNSS